MPPGFDRLESFGHDELTTKHCYFRCSRSPDVDGIKIFDKDDQAAKHYDTVLHYGFQKSGHNFDDWTLVTRFAKTQHNVWKSRFLHQ